MPRRRKKMIVETRNDIRAVASPASIPATIIKRECKTRTSSSRTIKKSTLLFSFCVWFIPLLLSALPSDWRNREYKRSGNLYSCDDDNTVRWKQGGDGHSGPFYPRCTRIKGRKIAGNRGVEISVDVERRAQDAAQMFQPFFHPITRFSLSILPAYYISPFSIGCGVRFDKLFLLE